MTPAAPYNPAELALLKCVRTEAGACLKSTRGGSGLYWAMVNRAYFNLENHLYIPRRPAEDDPDYASRPKRTSNMTRRGVEILCDHLYNPGPSRRLENDDAADGWLQGVYRDNHADALWQEADQFSTLNGTALFSVGATGDHDRPIKIHLWDRGDFEPYAEPDDPTCLFAATTIERHDEQTTYTVWTRLDRFVYRTKKLDAGQTAGGRVADFVPAESGPHGYGVLPFAACPYQPTSQGIESVGLGSALRRANVEIDAEMSDLAEAVKYYGRPLGFTRNVRNDWRPRLRPGSFQALPSGEKNATGAGALPEAFYLQAQLDVAGIWSDITNFANTTFEELGVPLSAVRLEQTGVVSGIAIVAEQAPLITRARGRQRPALRRETDLARVVLAVGGAYYDRPELSAAAADPQLCLTWPEPSIPIPGPDRDEADQAEIAMGLASPLMVLMRRRGITREQALEEVRQIAEDQRDVAAIRAEVLPPELIPPPPGTPPDDGQGNDRNGPSDGDDLIDDDDLEELP